MSIYYIPVLIYLLTCIQYTTMKNIEVLFKYVMCNIAVMGPVEGRTCEEILPNNPMVDHHLYPFKLQVSLVYAPWTNGQTHADTYKCKCTYIFIYTYRIIHMY